MKELVIISGKGGTGKTSLVASFARLAERKVLVDCDVDAADLHLVLAPEVVKRNVFKAGHTATIRPDLCSGCGKCREVCAFNAIQAVNGQGQGDGIVFQIDPLACEGCLVCTRFCPAKAITCEEAECGEWFVSNTAYGPMVHAQLGIAQENSGKLVTLVRQEGRTLAEREGLDLVMVDGPPGIGCPVIASIGGADLALIVTEPTLSALHDLERVRQLTRHFRVPTMICINKYDLNEQLSDDMVRKAEAMAVKVAGRIRYDAKVTQAQIAGASVVAHASDAPVSQEMAAVWRQVAQTLQLQEKP